MHQSFRMILWCIQSFRMILWCIQSFRMILWCIQPLRMMRWCISHLEWYCDAFSHLEWYCDAFSHLEWYRENFFYGIFYLKINVNICFSIGSCANNFHHRNFNQRSFDSSFARYPLRLQFLKIYLLRTRAPNEYIF